MLLLQSSGEWHSRQPELCAAKRQPLIVASVVVACLPACLPACLLTRLRGRGLVGCVLVRTRAGLREW